MSMRAKDPREYNKQRVKWNRENRKRKKAQGLTLQFKDGHWQWLPRKRARWTPTKGGSA